MRADPSDTPAPPEGPPRRRAARSAGQKLCRALIALSGGRAKITRHVERGWASITFSGTRHTLCLAFAGAEGVAAGEALIDALPEHEFTIPGQLVADASVVSVEHTLLPEPHLAVTAELLLLEES